MLIEHFEQKIKHEIDARLYIKYLNRDVAGVYFGHNYLDISVPRKHIYEQQNPEYTDRNGAPYRSVSQTMELIKAKMQKFI